MHSAAIQPSLTDSTLNIQMPSVEITTLEQGLELYITSPHLLPNQVIHWANAEQSQGRLYIPSQVTCSFEALTIGLSESIEINGSECFCDVDGYLYNREGGLCGG